MHVLVMGAGAVALVGEISAPMHRGHGQVVRTMTGGTARIVADLIAGLTLR